MSNPQLTYSKQILLFALDESRYALYLSAVERVVRAVETTPLPKAPGFVLGVINVQGQVIPVVNIRQRLHLPLHDLSPGDQFILAHTSQRRVALVVDIVVGTRKLEDRELVNSDQVLTGAEFIHGVAKLDDGLVLICDLDQFLSFDEERVLEATLVEAETKTQQKKRRKVRDTRNEG